MPYLSSLHTWPALVLTPAFNTTVVEYYARVPYSVYLLRVWAVAHSCYSEARLEEKYGLSRYVHNFIPMKWCTFLSRLENDVHLLINNITTNYPFN